MGKRVHICEVCNKTFEDYFDNTKYCSRSCYYESRQKDRKLKLIKCPICGNIFRQRYSQQQFCSRECLGKSNQNRVECICETCGKTFFRIRSEVDKKKRHYCSKECKDIGMSWSITDTEILRENYGKIKYKDMINIFSKPRTIDEISRRAIYVGLTSSREWSQKEVNILQQNYSVKSMKEIMALLPHRSLPSIMGKARTENIKSLFYLNHEYSQIDENYLKDNYLTKTNEELGIILNRSKSAISQHLSVMNLYRPTDIDHYQTLKNYIRSRLLVWKDNFRKKCNFTCALTGSRNNIIVHHIRGFNLLFNETAESIDMPLYDDISEYDEIQVDIFLNEFLLIQDYYNQYICITENVHKNFHGIYGYGNNTKEQWDEFVNKYYKN